ncbi:HMG-box protein [Obba rivulosa]|uniref:HMG-box protein n=1 Tax=Obba rivulosa TaxID=1052685 RepID=A0A8E2ANG2_9APHY|nr:HMG-box protein [Obba rivulosa]
MAKLGLMGSLGAVAEALRGCASQIDHFAQLVSHTPLTPNGMLPPANGQYAIAVHPPQTPATGKRKGRGAEDADGRKKVKKIKDPNAPKRPASSYLLFQNDVRKELRDKFPNMPNNELLSHIAELWKNMPPEQKDAYEQRQKVAKNEWMVQKTAYEARGTDAATPVAVTVSPVVAPAKVTEAAPVPSPETVATPVLASSEEEDSTEEQASSEAESSEEEAETPPPPKKARKSAAPTPVATSKVEKEKKHRKSKA